MYVCRWFVLCETVVQDKTLGNLTMVNAISVLRTLSFPALSLRFAFAARLHREGESAGPLLLRFVRETESGNEVLITTNGDGQAPEEVQFFFNFPMGIRLFKEGNIIFRVEAREGDADWYSIGSQSVHVIALAQQPAAPLDENAKPGDEPALGAG